MRGSPNANPQKVRVRNADGSINIHCRICNHFICKMQYAGITTSICHYCETGQVRQLDDSPQELLLRELYESAAEDMSMENKIAATKKKWSIRDMVVDTVRALGFGRKVINEEPTEEVKYIGVEKSTSKQIANSKKRTPIFGTKKKDG